MNISYLLWLIGVLIAVLVGIDIFYTEIGFVKTVLGQLEPNGAAKALFVSLGLVAISKLF